MKHTPGPWIVGPSKLDIVHGSKGRDPVTNARYLPIGYSVLVGNNHGLWVGITQAEAEANARLMAAAPDLLEALQKIANAQLESFDHSADLWEELAECVEVAQQAISKAKGRGEIMTLKDFIHKNKEDLDIAIKNACPNLERITNEERRLWVLNDEGLYNWARAEGVRI